MKLHGYGVPSDGLGGDNVFSGLQRSGCFWGAAVCETRGDPIPNGLFVIDRKSVV